MTEARDLQIAQVIADVLGIPVAQVTPDRAPDNVEGWDSVQHLNLMLAIEQAVGVQLEPEDIEEMQSVGAILEIVRRKSS